MSIPLGKDGAMMKTTVFCPLLLIGGYLLGSVSSAILVTWLWARKDIRTLGNRNAGVANVARSVGILPAAMVGVVDFSKGAIPVLLARMLGLSELCALGGAVAAVIGHSYPLYFRFRGGKGLATSLGALLAFTPIETFLVLPVLGLVYLVLTGSAVTGAVVSLGLLVGINLWRGYPLPVVLAPLVLLVTMGLCTLPQAIQDWRRAEGRGDVLMHWLAPREKSGRWGNVAVITDSIASLPDEVCAREGVHVVPLSLTLPEGTYRDGLDIDPRRFYRLLREDGVSPKTSSPSPGEFLALYRRLRKAHEAGVVITPPKELTQTWNSAHLAAQEMKDHFTVHVVDSRVAGPAQGFVALAAARTALAGAPLQDILNVIEATRDAVGFVGVLDTLKFLVAGGRVAESRQWMRSALRLYPVLYIRQGQIRLIGMARTKKKAIEQMVHWLRSNLPEGDLALAFCHTDALQEAKDLESRLVALFHPVEHFLTELSPVIGAHAGPGLVGVAWWARAAKT